MHVPTRAATVLPFIFIVGHVVYAHAPIPSMIVVGRELDAQIP
eukprot:SAG11_NODE_32025_length_287_cov_0.601064_1_plen_42_part_10